MEVAIPDPAAPFSDICRDGRTAPAQLARDAVSLFARKCHRGSIDLKRQFMRLFPNLELPKIFHRIVFASC